MAITFEKELCKVFAGNTFLIDTRFVGRNCYGRCTDTINMKAQFIPSTICSQYTASKITLLNRCEGQIDSIVLPLKDLWGMKKTNKPNSKESLNPHLWLEHGNLHWYAYQPTLLTLKCFRRKLKAILKFSKNPLKQCHTA